MSRDLVRCFGRPQGGFVIVSAFFNFLEVGRANRGAMKISTSTQLPAAPLFCRFGRRHDMHVRFALIVFSLFLLHSCIAYAPVPAPAIYHVPSNRTAWENAQRAAEDVGIHITSADEASGTIEGQAGRTAVTIRVKRQSDERIRLEVSLRGPSQDTFIADAFHRAYEQRVGGR
jgi:hypothetical protein